MILRLALASDVSISFPGVESDIVLVSRSMDGMKGTQAIISSVAPSIRVHTVQADLGDVENLSKVFSDAVQYASEEKHKDVVLVHNSGSLGDISKPAAAFTDPAEIRSYFDLNFTSFTALTAYFLSYFNSGKQQRSIMHMSSSLSYKFRPSFSLYSSGKAARNALMGVVVAENPDVRVLNYTPGAVDTVMLQTIPQESHSDETRSIFQNMYDKRTVISTEQSVKRLVEILQKNKYANGALIDYWDKQ